MSDGKYLLHLLAGIEPRALNWDLAMAGENEEELKNNAKYVISVARSLNAIIFAVWEDFVEVNPKQMLIFFAVMNEIQTDMLANKKE